ncbi:MAG TPA: ribonuclease P protein component, partial [Saprospiraceae bacterium]|nr:ribonuclease P protein component [Saprospiraceae bacterium]
MSPNKQTFCKAEKLKSAIRIKEVYASGKQLFAYPFKLYLLENKEVDAQTMHRVCFSVPKRNFKSSPSRNLLKRRSREAYRLHKVILDTDGLKFDMYWIYIGKIEEPYTVIEKGLIKLL